MNRPTLRWLSPSSVVYTYDPPAGSDDSKIIKYTSNYRKHTDSEWTPLTETTDRYQLVDDLHEETIYELTVTAKYQGQDLEHKSPPLFFKTDAGK